VAELDRHAAAGGLGVEAGEGLADVEPHGEKVQQVGASVFFKSLCSQR
jgi:hypothetical protein